MGFYGAFAGVLIGEFGATVAPILNGENIEKAVFVASPIKKPRYKNCNVATFGGGGN